MTRFGSGHWKLAWASISAVSLDSQVETSVDS